MRGLAIHKFILKKIIERYSGIPGIEIGAKWHGTRVFVDAIPRYSPPQLKSPLSKNEFPLLECSSENGNYFIMTTKKILSIYSGKLYRLKYIDYWWYDNDGFIKFVNNLARTSNNFVYYSLDREECLFEIDSDLGSDIAHNCINYYMDRIYPKAKPSLNIFYGRSE